MADVIRDTELLIVTYATRCRVLERQLAALGIEPAPTPKGRELALAADIIEGRGPSLNTVETNYLAERLRGLATWIE